MFGRFAGSLVALCYGVETAVWVGGSLAITAVAIVVELVRSPRSSARRDRSPVAAGSTRDDRSVVYPDISLEASHT